MPIHGYPGNIITANPTAPTVSSASGVWSTEQQLLAVNQGNWPGYEYPLANSLRFNSADSAYLNRTPASTSNRQIWTYSTWVKRSSVAASKVLLGAVGSSRVTYIWFNASNNLGIYSATASGGGDGGEYVSSAIYRDPSAWYHIVVAYDSTQATSTNRIKAYVNGIQITAWATATAPTLNHETQYNWTGAPMQLGAYNTGSFFDGYLTEVNFIDGQALDPSSFGLNDPETGVWSPKRYTGTYGTNGFYLPMTTEGQWSGYFDGTGDYLTVADSPNLSFGTNPFTVECWFYRTSASTTHGLMSLQQNGTGYAAIRAQLNSAGSFDVYMSTSGTGWANSFTGIGSVSLNTWNHFAIVRESGGAIKIYLNGTQINTTATNANTLLDSTTNAIGAVYSGGYLPFIGYISNFRSVVGTAVYTGNFTPPTSQLTAITNTQLLTCQSSTFVDNSANALAVTAAGDSRPQQFSPFADSIDDRSGQGNHWIPNNLDLRTTGVGGDIMVDVPTSYGTDTGVGGEVRGNYCTMNPLTVATLPTLANGNLDVSVSATGVKIAQGTYQFPSSGKWYYECTFNNASSGVNGMFIGITSPTRGPNVTRSTAGAYFFYASSSGLLNSNGTDIVTGLSVISANEVFKVAVDIDNSKVWIGRGSTWYNSSGGTTGDPAAGTNPTFSISASGLTPMSGFDASSVSLSMNFGQRTWAQTCPSGFKSLCTQNLPTPTIGTTSTTQAGKYFNPVLYSGNGSNQSITSVGFQPDFVWVKSRSAAQNHGLYDAVRGVGRALQSNLTNAESNYFPYGVQSFDSSGFTVADDAGSSYAVNGSTGSPTYVAWNWKANGAGSTNTAGTITSTVSANTTSGFSIVQWTGSGANGTVGHGLGVAPQFMFMKNKTNSGTGWPSYHAFIDASAPQNYYISLADTAGRVSASNAWNNTAPTSSVFSVGSSSFSNGGTMIAYVFAPVAGYSAFGSYTGNGSADGPFVYTGFRPRYILLKGTDASVRRWCIVDTARSTYNTSGLRIYAELSNAEDVGGGSAYDIVSNGFKLRDADGNFNASGVAYIYAAFAEHPFKYSLAR